MQAETISPLWGNDPPIDLGGLLSQPAWYADALCREHPEVDWFPAPGHDARPAQAICARCLVQVECLDQALARPDDIGVWGGTTAKGRQRLRRAPDAPVVHRKRHDTRRRVLELLTREGPCTPQAVALRVRIGQQAVTRMLYRLAAEGEVLRYAGDTFAARTGA